MLLGHRENFLYLNEAVTDTIAQEIYEEYLQRTGDREYFDSERAGYHEAYLGSRVLTKASVEIIASATGIPSEKVWEGFIQGYMSGVDLNSRELRESIEEVLFPGFMSKIKNAKSEEALPLERLVEQARNLPLSEEVKGKINAAFKKYQDWLQEIEQRQKGKSVFRKFWENQLMD